MPMFMRLSTLLLRDSSSDAASKLCLWSKPWFTPGRVGCAVSEDGNQKQTHMKDLEGVVW
jgi:hypothetical protein